MRLLGIAKVWAVSRADRQCACTRHVAGSFGGRMHRAESGIQIAPPPVPIPNPSQPPVRAFDTNYATIALPRTFNRVGLDNGIVLLKDPTLAANILARKQLLQIFCEIGSHSELYMLGHFPRHRRLPSLEWASVQRGVVSQSGVWNIGDDFAVLQHPHARLTNHPPDFDRIHP